MIEINKYGRSGERINYLVYKYSTDYWPQRQYIKGTYYLPRYVWLTNDIHALITDGSHTVSATPGRFVRDVRTSHDLRFFVYCIKPCAPPVDNCGEPQLISCLQCLKVHHHLCTNQHLQASAVEQHHQKNQESRLRPFPAISQQPWRSRLPSLLVILYSTGLNMCGWYPPLFIATTASLRSTGYLVSTECVESNTQDAYGRILESHKSVKLSSIFEKRDQA